MIRLIACGPQDFADLIGAQDWRGFAIPDGGLEPEAVLVMLQGWSARLDAAQGWGTWLAVAQGEVVASLAVKDVPRDGSVEVGYGTAPARRGRGHATAALGLVLAELAEKGLRRVTAETAVDNPASGRVVAKAGFQQVGSRNDPEDGALILWARDLV